MATVHTIFDEADACAVHAISPRRCSEPATRSHEQVGPRVVVTDDAGVTAAAYPNILDDTQARSIATKDVVDSIALLPTARLLTLARLASLLEDRGQTIALALTEVLREELEGASASVPLVPATTT